jgi:uncharacterized protein (DUF433 family)
MFLRISSNPAILGGKPCIKGTRISVQLLLELIGSGATFDDIMVSYPHIVREDLEEALKYASRFLKEIIRRDLEFHPPFIIVAERMKNRIKIRIREF